MNLTKSQISAVFGRQFVLNLFSWMQVSCNEIVKIECGVSNQADNGRTVKIRDIHHVMCQIFDSILKLVSRESKERVWNKLRERRNISSREGLPV